MWGALRDWMVERALPPDIDSPAQERAAVEAAENGIRQTATILGVAGAIIFAALLAVLYNTAGPRLFRPLPDVPVAPGRSEAVDTVALRQAAEESAKRLDEVTKERDTLQSKVIELQQHVAELDGRLQAAKQIEDTKQPASKEAPKPAPIPSQAKNVSKAAAAVPSVYQCGDGRTVRNPGACRSVAGASTQPQPEEVPATPPTAYYCGDGRAVPDPETCKPATTPQ